MRISVFVPEFGVIEAVTPPFRSFHTANEFLTTFGKKPVFEVEYVGLHEYVPANNGEYTIKTDRLLKDVASTDYFLYPQHLAIYPREYLLTQRRYLILNSYTRVVRAWPVCVLVLFY